MQNPILKFRQSSCISEKPGYLSEKFKTLTSSNYLKVYNFLLKLSTRLCLTNVHKRMYGIFLKFCLDLELLIKLVVEARQNFQFFRQNKSKILYGILHYFISITKL